MRHYLLFKNMCGRVTLNKQSSNDGLIDRLFHKTLPLKFNEFIPYFWLLAFGIKRETPLLSKDGLFFLLMCFLRKARVKCIFRFAYFNG